MGWFKRHWRGLLSAIPLAPPVYRWAKNLIGFGGDVDFVVSRSEDPAWLGRMFNLLTDPPAWSIAPMILAGLGLIWWDVRRAAARRETPEPAPSLTSRLERREPSFGGHHLPVTTAPLRPAERVEDASKATLSAKSAVVPAEPTPDWGKLYGLSDIGKLVRLRFLPDTEDQEDDTALLVVFGHKVMRERDRVLARSVSHETRRAMREAPNSRIPRFAEHRLLMRELTQQQPEVGQGHIDRGLLRHVGLAQGGFYEMTPDGEARARMLAHDLIHRA